MATIKSQMTLNDGMSAVLKKITHALDVTLASFEQLQRASGAAVDVASIEAARGALASASRAVDEMEESFQQAARAADRLNGTIDQGAAGTDNLLKKAVSLAGAYMSLSSIKGFSSDALEAANIQINAQRQLHTVLDNMGAAGLDGVPVRMEAQADTAQAASAYDTILAKASEVQGGGIYGDEAMIAGAAEFATYFEDANAILSMMDTLTDYAMGMSGGGALDTTAMVDYATGLGKIMSGSYDAMTKKGFEFTDTQKAIIEGTATESQIVAELGEEYLGMSQDMQAAAAINAVIAEGWGGLYEAMSNTPEGKLIQLNNTLGDIKENVGAGIYPAVMDFVDAIQGNLPQIESAAMGLAAALGFVITLMAGLVEGAISFGTAVADNWGWISPIVYGIVAALTAYAVVSGIVAAGNAIHAASEGVKAAAQMMAAGATLAETAAQHGLNAALAACPVTWIVLGVIALVAGIMALCGWIAKTTGLAQTGFGIITGGISVVVQAIVNAGLFAANVAIGIGSAFLAVCSNIGTAFHNVIANVQSWFYGLLSTALTVVAGICAALNLLPFVEFDYSGITSKADEYAARSAEAANSKEEYASIADAFSEGFGTFDAYSEGWASDAFQAGAAWGDSVAGKVGGMFDGLGYEPGSIEEFANQGFGGLDGAALDGLGSDVGDIADNTGGMAQALEVSGEELKYLRDIAERDAVNRFTTAEVKIDMTGMTNKIDGGNDLDGVIRELTDGFSEALVTAAEGVHE